MGDAPRLIFLGTAGDASTMAKQALPSGGIVLTDNNLQIQIDPGPGMLVRAAQWDVSVRNTDVLLVSDNRVPSCGDLNATIETMTLEGLDRKGVLLCPHSVVSESEGSWPTIGKAQRDHLERVIALRATDKVGIGDIDIIPTATSAPDEERIGFKIVTPQYIIGYTAQTEHNQGTSRQYEDCDILIISRNPDLDVEKDSEGIINLLKQTKPKLALFTHFDIKAFRGDILAIARNIQQKSGVQVTAAKGGLVVNPLTHANKSRQKKLS